MYSLVSTVIMVISFGCVCSLTLKQLAGCLSKVWLVKVVPLCSLCCVVGGEVGHASVRLLCLPLLVLISSTTF